MPLRTALAAIVIALVTCRCALAAEPESPRWTPTGWGGGGFYYAAAFHPTRPGVIYLGGRRPPTCRRR